MFLFYYYLIVIRWLSLLHESFSQPSSLSPTLTNSEENQSDTFFLHSLDALNNRRIAEGTYNRNSGSDNNNKHQIEKYNDGDYNDNDEDNFNYYYKLRNSENKNGFADASGFPQLVENEQRSDFFRSSFIESERLKLILEQQQQQSQAAAEAATESAATPHCTSIVFSKETKESTANIAGVLYC